MVMVAVAIARGITIRPVTRTAVMIAGTIAIGRGQGRDYTEKADDGPKRCPIATIEVAAARPSQISKIGGRHSSSASSVALPPEAAVFTVTTCSSEKRCR